MGIPGGSEILIIILVLVVIFGIRRLPQMGDALGKSIKNFKKGIRNEEIDVTPRPGVEGTQSGPSAASESQKEDATSQKQGKTD